MPLRPFGLPTTSIQSRFLTEMMIMKPVKEIGGASPDVLQRVGDHFITRLYGDDAAEGRDRPLIRLSIVEIDTLASIALETCSDNPDDPEAAQRELERRLQRKRPGATIFGLVEGDRIETLGRDIILFGRSLPTDPQASLPPAISFHLEHPDGHPVDLDDEHDDLVDEDSPFVAIVLDDED